MHEAYSSMSDDDMTFLRFYDRASREYAKAVRHSGQFPGLSLSTRVTVMEIKLEEVLSPNMRTLLLLPFV